MSESVRESAKKPEAGKEDRTSQTRKSYNSQPANFSVDRILFLQRTIGNRAVERLIKSGALQSKLKIGQPDDIYEHEADRVAEQVMRMPDPRYVPQSPVNSQPVGSSIQSAGRYPEIDIQRKEDDDEEEGIVQMKQGLQPCAAGSQPDVPPIVHEVLSSPGVLLDPATRAYMEPRFVHDFSKVRVHSGAAAEQSARDVNAKAYTRGHDIVFGAGRFAPGTDEGRRLLAHELTHVVQQSRGGEAFIQRSLEGCQNLLSNPSAVSLISGSLVHRIIGAHFQGTVADARRVVIPGASAGPLRSQGLCGGPDPVIDPQVVGGISGAGIPDLARITPGGILQVAEIKPAALPCLVDGEEQMLRYIDQGNARDMAQIAWRTSLGVTVVSPMLESAYSPPNLQVSVPGVARAELRTAWCTPGLLAYTVNVSGEPVLVRVPGAQRVEARNRLQRETISQGIPIAVGVGATAVAAVAGRALWRHFWRAVIERFAIRGAIALGLSAADGPLPFGELISLGLAVVTVIQIISDWNDLWSEADRIATEGA